MNSFVLIGIVFFVTAVSLGFLGLALKLSASTISGSPVPYPRSLLVGLGMLVITAAVGAATLAIPAITQGVVALLLVATAVLSMIAATLWIISSGFAVSTWQAINIYLLAQAWVWIFSIPFVLLFGSLANAFMPVIFGAYFGHQ